METKTVKETGFFGSKKMVKEHRSDYDVQPIEDYKWGYILNHENIVGGSFKLSDGLEVESSIHNGKEIYTVLMPYSMLDDNEFSYEGIEFNIEVCHCCGLEKE